MAANFPLIILALTVVIWAFVTMVMRVSNGPTVGSGIIAMNQLSKECFSNAAHFPVLNHVLRDTFDGLHMWLNDM
ncbi:hypothetical protein CGGC5_v016830 [Colletotrichum fructicola Nara gc5]|nr:hypothetical protein CGGC5_v016830 [Colletotrichum fructicola Nara gc5]